MKIKKQKSICLQFNKEEQKCIKNEPMKATKRIIDIHNKWQNDSLRSKLRF